MLWDRARRGLIIGGKDRTRRAGQARIDQKRRQVGNAQDRVKSLALAGHHAGEFDKAGHNYAAQLLRHRIRQRLDLIAATRADN